MTVYILNPDKDQSRDNFIDDLIAAVPEAEQQLRDLRDFINDTVAEAENQESNADDLQNQVDDLEGEKDTLETELEEAQDEIAELKEKIEELENNATE